jgi:hypothetical protein
VKTLFDIIHQDETKLQFSREGMTIDYFPTKKFMLPADSAAVVNSGTVKPEIADQIVPLTWTIDRWGLQRNNVIMLDFLAHNNWERPVYFATTTGTDSYIGLTNYFQIEGMAYRLLPVKTPRQGQDIGRVDTDILFDNLVNKFGSGMEDPDVYLSEDNLRMSMSLRNIYGRLALQLIAEGKKDSAVIVCDKIMELVPPESIPYNYFVIAIADAYLMAGETEKGLAILEGIYTLTIENLEYFFRFKGRKAMLVDDMKKHYLSMSHEIKETASRNGQSDLESRADDTFNNYYNIYVSEVGFQ